MYRRTFRRLLSALVLVAVAAAFSIVPQVARPPSAFANVTTGGSNCGVLTAYVAATPLMPGQIVIGNIAFPIAPGTTLSGNPSLLLFSNVCLTVTVNASGQIIGGSLTAFLTNAVNVCGVVTAFTAAGSSLAGSITIGGQTYAIAPGVALTASGLIGAGAVCLTASLNGAGQISSGSFSGITSPTNTITLCGAFGGFTPATAGTPGSIVISGQTIAIAPGVVLTGVTAPAVNTTICLSGTTNASRQLLAGTVSQTVLGPVTTCGVVTAYTLSTASTAGSLTIGGQTYPIAAGVTLAGSDLLASTANPTLCLQANLNGAGQIASGTLSLTLGGAPTVNVCGMVTAYTAATASAGGTITVAGTTLSIVAGAVFAGASQPAVGSAVCLSLVVNASGAIVGGTVVNTTNGIPLSATLGTPHHGLRSQPIRE